MQYSHQRMFSDPIARSEGGARLSLWTRRQHLAVPNGLFSEPLYPSMPHPSKQRKEGSVPNHRFFRVTFLDMD